jgi:hypothetical protein
MIADCIINSGAPSGRAAIVWYHDRAGPAGGERYLAA